MARETSNVDALDALDDLVSQTHNPFHIVDREVVISLGRYLSIRPACVNIQFQTNI